MVVVVLDVLNYIEELLPWSLHQYVPSWSIAFCSQVSPLFEIA